MKEVCVEAFQSSNRIESNQIESNGIKNGYNGILTVIWYHHGHRSKQSFQVIWQFSSPCIPRVHCNKSSTRWNQSDLTALKHEPRCLKNKKQWLIDSEAIRNLKDGAVITDAEILLHKSPPVYLSLGKMA